MIKKTIRIKFFKSLLVMCVVVSVVNFFTPENAKAINAANLFLSPATQTVTVGNYVDLTVMVSSLDVPMNTANGTLSFSPSNLLTVDKIVTKNSLVGLWAPNGDPNDNATNSGLDFARVITNAAGYKGSSGNLFIIHFKAIAPGVASINFNSGAGVKESDGNGTDMVVTTDNAAITVVPAPVVSSSPPIPSNVSISSPTHPDQNVWYSNNDPKLNWTPIATQSSFILDGISNTIPDKTSEGALNTKTYTNVLDGVSYFHVREGVSNVWGNPGHFKLQIDTVSPETFIVTEKSRATENQVSFSYSATDQTSGVDFYEFRIDNKCLQIIIDNNSGTYITPELVPGDHTLLARVYDHAKNYTDRMTTFNVEGPNNLQIETPPSDDIIDQVCDLFATTNKPIESGTPFVSNLIVLLAGLLSGTFLLARSLFGSLSGLAFFPSRLWGLFSVAVGLKRRFVPWGTVYDSVTKQPIDPAIVTIFDSAGKEVTQLITDLDGRYGFLLAPGTYTLTARKTHYSFPSNKLRGRKSDEVYNDLYFGGTFKISDKEPVVKMDIPLDPLEFDWNEFQKKKLGLMKFYSRGELIALRIADLIFYIGFIFSGIAILSSLTIYNAVIFSLYILLFVLRFLGRDSRSYGRIINGSNGNPLSFAILSVLTPNRWTVITKKVADSYGRYFCLVPKGTYAITIEKKVTDGSYVKILENPDVKVKSGIIKNDFKV